MPDDQRGGGQEPSGQTNATIGGINSAALAQAIAAAVGAAVTVSLQEITNKLNAITTRLESRTTTSNTEDSVNLDNNFQTNIAGSDDPFDEKRRTAIIQNRLLSAAMENQDLAMKEFLKYTAGVWARNLDHYCATNPDIPPRSPGAKATPQQ